MTPSSDLHIYGIDASGGGLAALEALPHCGAVVSRHDTERLERLVARLVGELTRRQRLIAQHDSAGLGELRSKLPKDRRPARILVLVDGWDALSAMLDDYDGGRVYSEVVRLLREGAAAGIHVIATSERLLLGGRLAAHNDNRLLLKQADLSDYNIAGLGRNKVPAHIPRGAAGWRPAGSRRRSRCCRRRTGATRRTRCARSAAVRRPGTRSCRRPGGRSGWRNCRR